MSETILHIANKPIFWVLCSITVIITIIQAVIFTRLARKTANTIGVPKSTCDKAFKTGMISSIGPSIGVFIVMVGLMSTIGGPLSWLRLSVIGAAPTELTAAKIGAEVAGVTFGGSGYTTETLALSWITMTLNGAGWLLFTGLFAHKLEKLRVKVGGGDSKWLVALSGASMLGVFGYLNAGDVAKGGGNLVAVIVGALFMIFMVTKVTVKYPKLKEYSLGIAMLCGMIGAVLYDVLFL
ncbi:MAG: DUF5058 family protein [Clostridium cadaveris]|uniref:DUF5058 domain-containing protein n=1 Tax=Clostridium cadaveris TaxID=1529 RepID=A0A1I2JKJ2_9CLOT|nr:DUF5058 family protein [Clostridium cadaveris]MDM8311066.1 DUF5058 family protein [Clostridium cadaveris]MDY4948151.1 DUF5058 family protein [Clostridium cadaveris]NWK10618.1 DUF5058 family protein [Clostridium cadaveris]UFH66062.1 DUF5058 family protein [Clostridium cadaveris]SFF55362.1 protein of unknown function [Clostridium cadaveris]